ncbi:universal stress protein [Fimbriimonas ginsengisoli]|uniref:universal stress protein n=1 Tax=Fimbriimonas ginsengisoli TaxID=1005039 RepID=UPI001D0F1251|nr:universal stress protein [Fimbriimonas ginsengisoli]
MVIGVDESLSSRNAIDLFLKLRFAAPQAIFVHVIESVMPDGSFVDFPDDHPLGALMRESMSEGEKLLGRAHRRSMAFGVEAKVEIVKGNPAQVLQEVATRESADLIVVGCNRRSRLDDLILGGTPRTLLHEAPQSLLVVRSPVLRIGPLRGVFAVDHREEPEEFVDALLQLKPGGIGCLDVLTINEAGHRELASVSRLPAPVADVCSWIDEGIRSKNVALADRLSSLGADCRAVVMEGDMPACAIAIAANRAHADFIVVGAKRHGFLDRHLGRSVSKGLLASDRRALLVLRPKEEKQSSVADMPSP